MSITFENTSDRYGVNPLVNEIFLLCDPEIQRDHETDHFIAFEQVHAIVVKLLL